MVPSSATAVTTVIATPPFWGLGKPIDNLPRSNRTSSHSRYHWTLVQCQAWVHRKWVGRSTAPGRQRDGELRAAVGVIPGPYLSAVALDDRAADRKPHPQPVLLAGDEGLEHGLQLLRVDSGAVVLHFEQHPRSADRTRAHHQPPRAVVFGRVHGAKCVEHQVHHHLSELDGVA